MFICRTQLLRTHNPIRLVPPHTIRRVTPPVRYYALNVVDVLFRHRAVVPPNGAEEPDPTSPPCTRPEDHIHPNPDLGQSRQEENAESAPEKLSNTTLSHPEANEKSKLLPASISLYLRMRRHQPDSLLEYSPASFVPLLRVITQPNYSRILDYFVTDVTKFYAPHNPKHGLELITIILRLFLVKNRILSKEQIRSLLQVLHDTGQIKRMQENMRVPIVRSLISLTEDPIDVNIIDLVVPMLIDLISEREPTKEHSPRVVWPLYCVTQRLIMLGQYQKALNVFHVLVHTENVTTSSITPTQVAEQDFSAIIISSLVRSSVRWGWYVRAKDLLREAMEHSKKTTGVIIPAYRKLAAELIAPLLSIAVQPDISSAMQFICLLMDYGELDVGPPFKRSPLYQFYVKAHLVNEVDLAEKVYSYSQSTKIAAKVQQKYPAPPKEAAKWLLNALSKKQNIGLARTLVRQIVEEDAHIPFHDRPYIIGIAASRGLAGPARALWERWTSGTPHQRMYVTGNAFATIRLVSVFANLLRRRGSKTGDEDVLEAYPWLKQTSRRHEKGIRQPLQSVPPEGRPSASADESVVASPGNVGEESLALPDASNPCDESSDAEEIKNSAEELRAFASRVVAEFRQSLKPLKEASHISLSALARAYFLLGDHVNGFAVFNFMLQRHMILDLYDMNIILAAMAHHDPLHAMRMLERMVDRGISPDAVSFGTIIHYAILHGRQDLVSAAIVRAKQLGIESFTFKTLGTILHATTRSILTLEGDAADGLDGARDIIQTMVAAKYTPSPAMGRDVVIAALKNDSPRIAFRFWKMLIKNNAEWKDGAQKRLREKIANSIREQYDQGWLKHDIGQSMLVQLREGSITRRQAQRGEAVTSDIDISPGAQGERESK